MSALSVAGASELLAEAPGREKRTAGSKRLEFGLWNCHLSPDQHDVLSRNDFPAGNYTNTPTGIHRSVRIR